MPYFSRAFTLFVTVALCIFWCWLSIHHERQNTLPPSLENQMILIQGKIQSLPETMSHEITFLFHISQINSQQKSLFVRLYWSHPPTNPALTFGQKWQLTTKLKRPHGYANPGGFNQEIWALANHLAASGRVVNSSSNLLLDNANHGFHPINRLREHINHLIDISLGNHPEKGMIKAFIIGERNDVTPMQWQIFSDTGTNHLIAIAGLHIGFLSGFAFFISQWLWRRNSKLCLYLPAQKIGTISAIIAASFYSALSGFLIPTQRALLMMLVYAGNFLCDRYIHSWRVYFLAFFAVIFIDPVAVLSESFWLSFWALFIIHYGFWGRAFPGKILAWLRLQFLLTIGILPFTLFFFHNASLISILANLIAVPWVGITIIPLVFIACTLMLCHFAAGSTLLHLAAWQCAMLFRFLEILSTLPHAVWRTALPSASLLVIAAMGILIFFMPKGFPLRSLGLFGFLPLLFHAQANPRQGDFLFTLLDVGQGLSVVIQTHSHVLVYDTGPRFEAFDAGAEIISPFLWSQGINRINTLMISHGDNDHRGGAATVLNNFQTDAILTSVPKDFTTVTKTISVETCQLGQQWIWDDVKFTILAPAENSIFIDNNRSCILQVCARKHCALFPGDIEAPAEQDFLTRFSSQNLHADLLIAPHHGSKTSSTFPFVHTIQPQWVLFPVGYFNRFSFPNTEVVARYHQIGAKMLRADVNGAISGVITYSRGVENLSCYRGTCVIQN